MQRHPRDHSRAPRRDAERNATQPIAGQPRADDDEDELERPEHVPSLLTARELQAREPARSGPAEETPDRAPPAPRSGDTRRKK